MSGAGRLFLAVELPEPVRREIARATRTDAGRSTLPARPVPPENWHITLRFLGDADDAQSQALADALAGVGSRAPVAVRLDRWGAFPRPARASVVWLGASHGSPELTALAADTEAAAVRAGFDPDHRPFRAHVTIARLRAPGDVRGVLDALPGVSIAFTVREVTLFRSHLGSGPPRYEARARFPLGASP
jgi:RNA 2',3'-cyclic 3'-phosphodiesterase